jgi:hypothetical protein
VLKRNSSDAVEAHRDDPSVCPATGGEHYTDSHDIGVPYGGPHGWYVEIHCRKCGAEGQIPIAESDAEWEKLSERQLREFEDEEVEEGEE